MAGARVSGVGCRPSGVGTEGGEDEWIAGSYETLPHVLALVIGDWYARRSPLHGLLELELIEPDYLVTA